MDLITKTIENMTSEWREFSEINKNQLDKVNNLEEKIENIKNKVNNMQNNLVPGVMLDSHTSENFNNFIKNGPAILETKSFSSDQADRGEFAVAAEKYKEIISQISEISPMRMLASNDVISSNILELLIQDGDFDSGWVAEREIRGETNTPKLVQKKIHVHEIYSQPKATQRLLDDNYVNLESWLTQQLVQTFAKAENKAFINGDGINKPKGFLSYADQIEVCKVIEEGEINPEDLLILINSLEEAYHNNACFLMNRRTLSEIQKLKDDNGRFIWQASIADKMPETIFGIPVYCTSDMPAPEAGNFVIALADFKAAYKIVDRVGISIMKDPFTEKPFTKFYATKRVGGDVVDLKAIKLLKL